MRSFVLMLLALPAGTLASLQAKTLGMYVLVADDTDEVYTSTHQWTPKLHPYQQKGANLFYLTFINPSLMPDVPPAFTALAETRGTGASGAIPSNATILFAIGGEAYSKKPNPWEWLTSKEKAEAMAVDVAEWPSKHGCDGIDLDIEIGAGQASDAGKNLVAFVAKLRELAPNMIVTQPVMGSPTNVPAAGYLLEASYNKSHASPALGSVSRVGIMWYIGTESENYLDAYENGCTKHCTQWNCPLAACVPASDMVLGASGDADASTIAKLGSDVKTKGLGGFMVWYATLLDAATGKTALHYQGDDASAKQLDAWATALQTMQGGADIASAKTFSAKLRGSVLPKPQDSSKFVAATWKIGAWETGTDPDWNLCNGLAKKNKCTSPPMSGTQLPFEKCVGHITNATKPPSGTWDLDTAYPSIFDGEWGHSTDLVSNSLAGKDICSTGKSEAQWSNKMQKYATVAKKDPDNTFICVPDPDTGKKTAALMTWGHGLDKCGALYLMKNSEAPDRLVVLLQSGPRNWSMESTNQAYVCPASRQDPKHPSGSWLPASKCYSGGGCVQPLIHKVDWTCGSSDCDLPDGWSVATGGTQDEPPSCD